jgi:hypothetical protein
MPTPKKAASSPKNALSKPVQPDALAVFDGKKVVSMFEMTKLVNGHLV